MLKPTQLPVLLMALFSLTGLAHADLTLNGRSTVVAMSMQGSGQEKIWQEGTMIRRDLVDRGKSFSNIYDLKAKEVTVIDHSMRTATVFANTSIKQQVNATVDEKAIKIAVKPTGRVHKLQDWPCAEHNLTLTMPAEIGGEKLTFDMQGTVWLARDTPQQKEVAPILKLMTDPEFFMGVPALTKSSPVQAEGISEAIRHVAPMGLLCSVNMNLKYEGTGRVASLSKKMASRLSLTFLDYSTAPIPKGTFDIPAGYRVVKQ
jgi:hypothetical protein